MKCLLSLTHNLTALAVFYLGLSHGVLAQYIPMGGGPESLASKRVVVDSSYTLPPGSYEGPAFIALEPQPDQSSVLEISQQTLITGSVFHLKSKAQLRIRGAVLRGCQIIANSGAEVVLDSCILEDCILSFRQVEGSTFNAYRISNCLLQKVSWVNPCNEMGLEMLNCEVREQRRAETALRTTLLKPAHEQALNPSIRYTKFVDCDINSTVFANLSQVTFEKCRSSYTPGAALFSRSQDAQLADIPVAIRWLEGTPAEPPVLGGGLVLQKSEVPFPGGLTLMTQMENNRVSMQQMPSTPPVSLYTTLLERVQTSTNTSSTPAASSQSNLGLKLKQAHMNGLLIMQLPSGKMAGQVSRMNVTVMPGSSLLQFGQRVGSDMATAIHEVNKFVQLRYPEISARMEISFEEKYSDKDGPSAAVACALLAESLVTGKVWDPTFAITGDMNADGRVQPIGGVSAKVRGATKGACKIVAIPHKNAQSISDIMVMDGLLPLVSIHIFSIQSFEQAAELAGQERPALLQQALDEFAVIQSVVLRSPQQINSILRTPQAATRLQAILEKAPHSLSARYLLAYAQGGYPSALTISGSIEEADSNGMSLLNSIKNDFSSTVSNLQPDELGGTLNRLRNLRPRLDRRVWPYIDAMVDYGEVVRNELLKPTHSSPAKFNEFLAKVRRAASAIGTTKQSLLANPQVQEELGL